MKQLTSLVFSVLLIASANAQTVTESLKKAYLAFERDSQLSHAISSLYVIDAATGKVVFEKNSQVGLAGASTQKIITASTAFELLGKDFRYETRFSKRGTTIIADGSGDPTLGSGRYRMTTDTVIFQLLLEAAKRSGLKYINGIIVKPDPSDKIVPDGWINQDIGNYYGAASHQFNWKENQYDLVFIPGRKEGEDTRIDTTQTLYWKDILNQCRTGAAGSGDNGYIYFIPGDRQMIVRGTIPLGPARFSISGADPRPENSFQNAFARYAGNYFIAADPAAVMPAQAPETFYIHRSPGLDSISYWFLRKSINLYGEALINTLGSKLKGVSMTDSGVAVVKKFWKEKGIDENELNIHDGSGLSPLNRITTHAQVEILKYAKTRDWFPYFYAGFPEYNGMKMKSGTISDVKGFCGYHKSKEGKEYIFSFLVNNYNGRSASLVNKMFKVLDELK